MERRVILAIAIPTIMTGILAAILTSQYIEAMAQWPHKTFTKTDLSSSGNLTGVLDAW